MRPSLIAALILSVSASLCPAAERVALVIGNNAYQHLARLGNPQRDAQAVAGVLRTLKFEVETLQDVTAEAFYEGLEKLKIRAAGAELALVYFAGHGVEIDGKNYLLPVDAELATAGQLRTQAVALDALLADLEAAKVAAKVAILDCCRNDPLTRAWMTGRSAGAGGLAELKDSQLPSSTLVMFSAGPGQVAADGTGANSPFSEALVKRLSAPGQSLFDAFLGTSDDVMKVTGRRQEPWVKFDGAGRVFRELVMVPGGGAAVPLPVPPLPQSPLDRGVVGGRYESVLPGGGKLAFRYCPPGNFMMGSPAAEKDRSDDEKQVPVRITKGYWLAETECTQGQWQAVMGANPSKFSGSPQLPVGQVSWDDVQGFLEKLNRASGLPVGWKWALPTEAQWEYGCRAGTTTVFSFGDSLGSREANFDGNYPYGNASKGTYLEKTAAVGSYAANGWGLHDMHGNVWEWCADWYDETLTSGADPEGPNTGVSRVRRGGSWDGSAAFCRAADRNWFQPGNRAYSLGFRPALVPSGSK
jgi:sulfatase modifying factor 1